MADFLLELGMEEIPARMIAAAEMELKRRVLDLLVRERLAVPAAESPAGFGESAEASFDPGFSVLSFSTPRRLAVLVHGAAIRQPDAEEQLTGPSWKIAFPDGRPSGAARAFAGKAGVETTALARIATPKGEYAAATVQRPGRNAVEVLAAGLPREIAALCWPKSMYWRPGKPERFVRPLRWLVCMLDEAIVPLEFAGVRASNSTRGHRILHGGAPVSLGRAGEYLSRLEAAYVLPDAPRRRRRIRESLDDAARGVAGARWREDEELLDQVTHLTEWPSAVLGAFEPEYLSLPEEVLVTVMRGHQKYFAIEDAEGRLAPRFLAVLNTETDPAGQAIIRHGNERVLRARFNDARFFWNYDQKIPLRDRVEKLKTVTFQKDLGSYFSKTEINLRTAGAFAAAAAEGGIPLDRAALNEAALLAKTDLSTELVKEFPELQGVVGGLYARAQGLGEAVARAISEQYIPASAEDRIPQTVEGRILGLADRMATIVEMFAIGLEPTGSRDPFALRRAANGVIKILAESELPLTLCAVEEIALRQSSRIRVEERRQALELFLRERLSFYLKETRGFGYDVVNAILATGLTTIHDAAARAQALAEVRGSNDLIAISTAFRRIKNILRQAAEGDPGVSQETRIVAADLTAPAERQLYEEMIKLAPQVESLRARRRYCEALERVAALRPAVDAFFDQVMVMAPEPHLRRNRLALIASIHSDFSKIADFSEIVASSA